MNIQEFKKKYDKALEFVLFAMMVAMATVVILGVSFRWAGHALTWYDEVASMQLAWLTYYGSAYAALKGGHISVPSILKSFPLHIRKPLFFLSKLFVYSFFILLTYYGFKVMFIVQGETLTTLDWFPQPLAQSVIPVASILFILSETLNFKDSYQQMMEGKIVGGEE
ncbi:TRAP-type C4-dicarboxylate transport system, small permease protein [alpha proteobacterium HIMB114]|jgi:TRAP-type C4-dicarboxylate transport system permease small subunit|nr:TRAP-type C4-dicarboxylate transport system, small permease protein [alpha proteobacterium HIMB114]